MLKGTEEDLPQEWYCSMNTSDPVNNNCDASEKSKEWYYLHYRLENIVYIDVENDGQVTHEKKYRIVEGSSPVKAGVSDKKEAENEQRERLTQNDEILKGLLKVSEKGNKSEWIRRYYFHEALLEPFDEGTTEVVEKAVEEAVAIKKKAANSEATGQVSVSSPSDRKKKRAIAGAAQTSASKQPQCDRNAAGSTKRSPNKNSSSSFQNDRTVPIKAEGKAKSTTPSRFSPRRAVKRTHDEEHGDKKHPAEVKGSGKKQPFSTRRRRTLKERHSPVKKPRLEQSQSSAKSEDRATKKPIAKREDVIEILSSSDESADEEEMNH